MWMVMRMGRRVAVHGLVARLGKATRSGVALAFMYLGVFAMGILVSISSWTTPMSTAWGHIGTARREALSASISAFPYIFIATAVGCVLVGTLLGSRGVAWHLFVLGAVATACLPFAGWVDYVAGELDLYGWAAILPRLAWVFGPLAAATGFVWLIVRRYSLSRMPPPSVAA